MNISEEEKGQLQIVLAHPGFDVVKKILNTMAENKDETDNVPTTIGEVLYRERAFEAKHVYKNLVTLLESYAR